jgi:xylose isomerase
MTEKKSLHSVCRWTFHQGAGGFVPGNIRPDWNADTFTTADFVRLVKDKIQPKLPDYVELGVEMHYDNEYNEKTADDIADACISSGLYVAMVTPGAHIHWGYGGIASLDPNERKAAEDYGIRSVDIAYGSLKKAWHPDPMKSPTIVVWNGSFGYDLATIGIKIMYQNLKESLADLTKYEEKKGGELYWGLEPKPNEGHPAMLLPTVASSILFWRKLEDEFGVSRAKKGVNMEFGHTEMIGLDHVYDYVEQFDNNAIFHTHLNSQGYNDGLILGGPGKYDIDFGVRINGMNVAIAGLFQEAGYIRWKGHDMQARSYDNMDQSIDRVVRSILSWEACDKAATELKRDELLGHLASRNTAKAEDMMRQAVVSANRYFDEMYS